MKFLTNLLFEPKGMHDQNAAYNIKDTVMSGDGSRVYFAIQDVPAGIPLNDSNYWKLQIDLSGSKSAMDQALASFADYAKVIGMRVRGETAKASGNPVTFLPDAGSLLQPVTVLDVQQAGSGDPSPSNIRPFIGYDKLDLNAAGINLFRLNQEYDYFFATAVAGDVITTQFDGSGSIQIRGLDVYPAGTYTISIAPVGEPPVMTLWMYYADNQEEVFLSDINANTTTVTFTANRPFRVALGSKHKHPVITCSYKVQLERDAVSSAYKSYAGKLHTVQIGQTVYGFRYEWLTGKGLIEWVTDILDGSEEWIDSAALGMKVIFTPGSELPATGVNAIAYMSHFKRSETLVLGAMQPNEFTFANANMSDSSTLSIRTDMSIDEFKTYLAGQKAAGTPVQFTRKLAAPIEIQLAPHIISAADPEQVNTLYGDGRIEAEYVKPLHVSIEERVAAALAAAKE